MKGRKENEVLSECLKYLQLSGLFVWRNNTGGVKVGSRFVRFGFVGSSDILGITRDGRFLAVECKREKGGRLSDAQRDFLGRIRADGGIALCVSSLEELKEKLEEAQNEGRDSEDSQHD